MDAGAELDSSIWADLFEAPKKPVKPGPEPPRPVIDDDPDPDPVPAGLYHAKETPDGFRLNGNKDFKFEGMERIRVDVGYAFEGESKSWKKWNSSDFDLHMENMVNYSNVAKFTPLAGNSFEIHVNRNDFLIEVTGFDKNREIVFYPRRIK